MANCTNCGSPLGEAQTFCGNCGQPVGVEAAAAAKAAAEAPSAVPAAPVAAAAGTPPVAPPPPQFQQAPPVYNPPPAYGQAPGYPPGAYQAPRKSRKALWIGLAALLLAVVVACILVFVVFWDQIKDGGGAATGPEKAVEKLLNAMESKDIDGFFDAMAPGAFDEMTQMGLSLDDIKAMFADEVFTYESIEFSGVKMETEDAGDGTATVNIVAGTVSLTEDGETKKEDVRDSDAPVEFQCVEVDGEWYIGPDTFF